MNISGRFWKCALAICVAIDFLLPMQALADDPFTVTSTNDGAGLFTFTVSPNPGWYWWFYTDDVFCMATYGVVSMTAPAGWTNQIADDGWVYWQPESNLHYISNGDTLTFSFHSIYTNSTSYEALPGVDRFGRCIISGVAGVGTPVPIAGGYAMYPIVGPDPGPLPTLSIHCVGSNTVISWPGVTNDYTLQSSLYPPPTTNWSIVTNLAAQVGGNCVVTNAASGMLFYRLSRLLDVPE